MAIRSVGLREFAVTGYFSSIYSIPLKQYLLKRRNQSTEHLIRHYRETDDKLDPIGKIEGNSFQIYEMLKIRDALIKKDVPDAIKNEIMLINNFQPGIRNSHKMR